MIYLYVILSSSITTLVIAFLVFYFRNKIINLIQYSTKYRFDRKLEDYKEEEIKRQKSVLIAELIAEWLSKPEDIKRLNQLTLEAFIWLPKETTNKLSSILTLSDGAPNVRVLISEVRQLILGAEESIDPNSIILFNKKEEDK